jgi:excisionase family DNA binding protein
MEVTTKRPAPQRSIAPPVISTGKKGASEITGLSVSTIEKNLASIPHYRFGRRVLFEVEALRQWVREQVAATSSREG